MSPTSSAVEALLAATLARFHQVDIPDRRRRQSVGDARFES
jgi:hypothetical protein